MKKVLLKGYFRKNLGDDLFFHMILSRYKNQFESLDIGEYDPLANFDNFKGKRNFAHKIVDLVWDKVFNKYKLMESINKKNYDLMVYIGGSIFIENSNYKKYYNKKSFEKNYIPYYFIGSNIGPFHNHDFLDYMIDEVYNKASDISLRDKSSYNLIKDKIDVARYNPDIIFDLKSCFELNSKESYKLSKSESILFSIIDIKDRNIDISREEYLNILVKMIKRVVSDGKKVGLMSFCSYEGDEDIITDILKSDLLKDEDISKYFYRGDMKEALEYLNNFDIIAGSRFHSHIIGLALGKYILPIPYSDKSINVLEDMSYKGEIIDLRNILNYKLDDFDVNNLKSYVDTEKYKKNSEKHFLKLDEVLVRRIDKHE